MGTFSIWHWLIVIVVAVLLFGGAGRIPRLMGDMAKGGKAFKSGMKDESDDNAAAKKQVTDEGGETTRTSETVERDKNVA